MNQFVRWTSLSLFGVVLALTLVADAAAAERPPGGADETVALRIRVGLKDKEATDWSGKLALSEGNVEAIRGWRWMAGDGAEGNEFTLSTRRKQAQNAAERKRVQGGERMPMSDNGVIVTLAGATESATVTFDAKPGKAEFKLADVPYGKPLDALDGNVQVERVPAAQAWTETNADEDYPSVAAGKDGIVAVAYLAFTHGKDFQGARERMATAESGPVTGPLQTGRVQKIEKPEDFDYLAQPAGGEQVFLRVRSGDGAWGEPIAVTDGKQELYRPAVAIDGDGKIWVFYSAHVGADATLDHGNWELMARRFDRDGTNAGAIVNVSSAPGSDFMPAAATDSQGKVAVTWVGGRESRFNVFVAAQEGEKFSAPKRISDSPGNEWEPAIAAGADGNLAVAWDTYAKGDYDVYLARRETDGSFGKPQAVAATLAFEVRPSLAYDAEGKLWVAWEESGDHWGKDFGALKKLGIPLYQTGRSLAMRVLARDGQWFTPPDVMDAMPQTTGARRPRAQRATAAGPGPAGVSGTISPCFPRLAAGADGNVWLAFRGKPGGNWRVQVGSVWFEYLTRLSGDAWSEAVWIPRSNNILDNRPAVVATPDALTVIFSGDGRGETNPPKLGDPHLSGAPDGGDPAGGAAAGAAVAEPDASALDDDAATAAAKPGKAADAKGKSTAAKGDELLQEDRPGQRRQRRQRADAGGLASINADLFVATVRGAGFGQAAAPVKVALAATQPAQPAAPAADVEGEREAIRAMREYRVNLNGESLRIWRGEFHRHTEFSPDGGGDGGLLDMWRYGIDAAELDWIGDGDHDYGSGREYSWWTTQKAVTLFTLPSHFVPMFCHERSVSYPEGHRNVMFAKRGIRSLPRLPITDRDKFAPAPDTNMLYQYLKHFDGLCASHTSATGMGTDWRNNDPQVEPFVEIYQGDRNNYERPDAPRSAVTEAKLKQSTPDKESIGGWEPKGFVNLALKMGYRLAFQSSSDHISTHLSYCNVLVTEPTRAAILEAVKKRRVYGATDNIIADVRCKVGGTEHFMGEEFTTSEPPVLNVRIVGAQKIAKVTIIKDDEEVHVAEPNQQDVSFTWTDPKPTPGKVSYYYVRGEQVKDMEGATAGELVWASPMWIKYEPKQ